MDADTVDLTQLRYHREIDPEAPDALARIAQRIGEGARVLDIGCSSGALGRFLSQHKGCTIDGIDFDVESVRVARQWYRKVVNSDLEVVELTKHFGIHSYDFIVCADVLEHLKSPERILLQLPSLLAPEGKVMISLPNVAYLGVVASLIQDQFEYRPLGLLDSSHFRFFTRTSVVELLRRTGFGINSMTTVRKELEESEFRSVRFDLLPPGLRRGLSENPDALTYQFVLEAQPGAGKLDPVPPSTYSTPRFSYQLYWRPLNESFREERSVVASGPIGEERQSLRFELPATSEAVQSLRLDFGDRPGFVHLFGLKLVDLENSPIWSWEGDMRALTRLERQEVLPLSSGLGDCVLLTGEDPYLELPILPSAAKRLMTGGALLVEVSWPMSPDFLIAKQVTEEQEARFQHEKEEVAKQISEIEQASAERLEEQKREFSSLTRDLVDQIGVLKARAADQDATGAASIFRRWGARLNPLWSLGSVFSRSLDLYPLPRNDVTSQADPERGWQSVGWDPWFELLPSTAKFPSGWVEIELEIRGEPGLALRPALYVDHGRGCSAQTRVPLPDPVQGKIRGLIWLPRPVRGLRLDPAERRGRFAIDRLRVRPVSQPEALARLTLPLLKAWIREPRQIQRAALKGIEVWKREGMVGLKQRLAKNGAGRPAEFSYGEWIRSYDTLLDSDRDAIRRRIDSFTRRPLISMLLPLRDCTEPLLKRALDGLVGQLYPRWELCIVGDVSSKVQFAELIAGYSKTDSRIKSFFESRNIALAPALNHAFEQTKGDFVAVLGEGSSLSEHALYMVAEEINSFPDAGLVYSDEDRIDAAGLRSEPFFKPDWNPDLFFALGYLGNLMAIRSTVAREVGGFRPKEGCEQFDWQLRCALSSKPERIRHIPCVLYHRAEGSPSALDPHAAETRRKLLRKELGQHGHSVRVEAGKISGSNWVRYGLPARPPLVSLLIPTRDQFRVFKQCIESILRETSYPNYEIVIIDNQSKDPDLLGYFEELAKMDRIKILRYAAPFNYSAINNLAAREARGDVLALLNNDLEVITKDWLKEMVGIALRPDVGAVGALLYYPDGSVQHAGVVVGIDGLASHVHRRLPRGEPGYFGRAQLTQEVSVVTAACMVVRREVFERAKGLDEGLRVAFNDVDFCLRLRRLGYRNIFTPFAELHHHESITRGLDDTPEKQARLRREVSFMVSRWGSELRADPFFSPNLTVEGPTCGLAFPPAVKHPWLPWVRQ